jgi:hypothetical protein
MVDIELSHLDLRYKDLRIRNRKQEGKLLSSIAERGIAEPLEGVDTEGVHLLLNGFKRYRCARKLNLKTVPYTCLGQDAVTGMVALLRSAQARSLNILEQAGFVDQLRTMQTLSLAETAELLSRSKAWVSLRTGLIGEMTDVIRQKLFRGVFPVYSYMYTLRPFMRINAASKQQIEAFVVAVSGKNLSVRQIEQLAHGYFRGSESFRAEILSGNIAMTLEKQGGDDAPGCNRFEREFLKDLELISNSMQRVLGTGHDRRLKTPAFYAQANLLTGRILDQSDNFIQTIRQLHDRSRQA